MIIGERLAKLTQVRQRGNPIDALTCEFNILELPRLHTNGNCFISFFKNDKDNDNDDDDDDVKRRWQFQNQDSYIICDPKKERIVG